MGAPGDLYASGHESDLLLPAAGGCARPFLQPKKTGRLRHRRIQGEVQDEHAWLLKGAAGHAGLFSNVPDLLRFAAAILNGAAPDPRRRRTRSALFEAANGGDFCAAAGPGRQFARAGLGYAFGELVLVRAAFSRSTRSGTWAISGCSLWIDLDAGVAVVLLTNRTWPDRQSQLIREIRPVFHDAVREAL